ncbi:type ISP restriction/modification enzyme [Sphingopyxis sp. MG]|uniref:type ISP restriction/modification enzyme n=1 Tax=Sphingopyxis sp. MG TaxID=1866325 RepID=UPI000CDF3311|nr:type ISP restriction/modification enzyme [Sphingopyxis sp. MG]AVA12460.1 hypothetical protein C3E99_00150 [Sphingopyxis sp. MG]
MTIHTAITVPADVKPAYIYARFSTMEQAKGHSLERQISLATAFVEQNGWRLDETFSDEGKSAFHGANREDGSSLFDFEKRAREGEFKQGAVLVIENIDRLSRQGAKAAARLIWMLNENGVDVATFQDGHVYKSGDEADLMDLFSIIVKAQLAYEESLKKSKRITAVWSAKHRAVINGESTPISRKTPEWICIKEGKYALVERRVEILNEIYDDYIGGLGEHYITKKLNDRKEENWGRGNGWHRSYIHKCLVNRRVLGEYIIHPRHDIERRGDVLHSSFYPQAITAEKFNKAQLVRASRQRTGGATQNAASNLFSGIAKCDECGGTMAYLAKGKDKRRPNSIATSYNSARRTRQKALDIRVVLGNPPYNVSDTGADYPHFNKRIADTYAKETTATNKNSLYDSYVRAIRWASDRIGDSGVIGFVTNGGWLDGNAMNGLRKCLRDEFSSIYVFNLRGNQRTSGELSKREGGKIFGQGSRAPVAISFLVKNPSAAATGQILYHDIGDYLTREQKLQKVAAFKSVSGMCDAGKWSTIVPDEHNDWITQRDSTFEKYIVVGERGTDSRSTLFSTFTTGVKTKRDAWSYNSSASKIVENISRSVKFYNGCLERFIASGGDSFEDFAPDEDASISWSRGLKNSFEKKRPVELKENAIRRSVYRPFFNQHLYFDRTFSDELSATGKIFPVQNAAIALTGVGARSFSALMVDIVPCLDCVEKGQFFPLKVLERTDSSNVDLFSGDGAATEFTQRDGITDYGLQHFQAAYPNATITKDDIFYYVYGLLHSEEYRERFADNLSKQLPRIPAVKQEADFWAFVEAGRKLGDLHVNYENVEPYAVTYKEGDLRLANVADPVAFYRVEQMKFAGKRPNLDKTTVIYNSNITMTNIPLEAYDYVVNGKSALDWVMERQCVKKDKASGIVNDANDYANETMHNPAYPLELFQRVITVSLETMKIVRSLPKLEID